MMSKIRFFIFFSVAVSLASCHSGSPLKPSTPEQALALHQIEKIRNVVGPDWTIYVDAEDEQLSRWVKAHREELGIQAGVTTLSDSNAATSSGAETRNVGLAIETAHQRDPRLSKHMTSIAYGGKNGEESEATIIRIDGDWTVESVEATKVW